MTTNTAPTVDIPNYHRPFKNIGAGLIPANRIVKMSGSVQHEGDVSTAVGDNFMGVTIEECPVGIMRSIQVDGRLRIEAGAAISRGDEITTDNVGRAVASVVGTDEIIGRAENTVAALGDFVMVEKRHR